MTQNLVITSSPHFRAKDTTTTIMRDVIIALMPAQIAAIYYFGARSLLLTAVCAAACVAFEYAYRRLMHLDITIRDLSAAVTGVLLAFNLPAGIPLWMAVIGCFVAIVVIKQLFGGLGKNFANPAIVGRIVLLASFATQMTTWPSPIDGVSGATPLGQASVLTDPVAIASGATVKIPGYLDMFLGNIAGSMGETCTLALLLGFAYLLARRVITPTAPVAFVGTVFLLSWMLTGDLMGPGGAVFQVLAGGLVLGAVFMATDYVTTPTTETGKLIFGVGAGLLTVVIRLYGSYPEGVSFAILIMNIITPHIDNLTRSKAFGGVQA